MTLLVSGYNHCIELFDFLYNLGSLIFDLESFLSFFIFSVDNSERYKNPLCTAPHGVNSPIYFVQYGESQIYNSKNRHSHKTVNLRLVFDLYTSEFDGLLNFQQ